MASTTKIMTCCVIIENCNLNETIEIALKGDYTIDTNEAEAISKLQTEVSEMTNKIAEAQNRAEIEAIKLDFKVSDLDAESFEMLQEQLQSAKKEADELAMEHATRWKRSKK